MKTEYERKFEKMKLYIPFLENMIQRLESTATSSGNPRLAQLHKIRALRELLLDKNKRLKMENLEKCEKVLINLYAKVEQKSTLPGIEPAAPEIAPSKEQNSLDVARRKLRDVELKNDDTFEIARANQSEVDCIPGSKEPALFHRRPYKTNIGETSTQKFEDKPSSSKRSYTRVLRSPERTPSKDCKSPKKSPKKSPRKLSPASHHKKEKKRSSRRDSDRSDNYNITLEVPEECLSSLKTEDLFERIINCDNADVDIKTLRDLKKQILSDLRQTTNKEDISELILESYTKKKKSNIDKNKEDVEDGEISDSESETIQSVYKDIAKVTVMDDIRILDEPKTSGIDIESGKIRVSLVISNPAKESERESKTSIDNTKNENNVNAETSAMNESETSVHLEEVVPSPKENRTRDPIKSSVLGIGCLDKSIFMDDLTIESREEAEKSKNTLDGINPKEQKKIIDPHTFDLNADSESSNVIDNDSFDLSSKNDVPMRKLNFYNPILESNTSEMKNKNADDKENKSNDVSEENITQVINHEPVDQKAEKGTLPKTNIVQPDIPIAPEEYLKSILENDGNNIVSQKEDNTKEPKIPFLSDAPAESIPPKESESKVSEIDILQALKNEILSENIAFPGAESTTPTLHQPKIAKVTNAQEIVKKKISIENYKRKSSNIPIYPLATAEDLSQKQSRALTAKELERFNFPLPLEDSSDDDEKKEKILANITVDDVYGDLAPRSPDCDARSDAERETPVIIPADPVNPPEKIASADVDMRTLLTGLAQPPVEQAMPDQNRKPSDVKIQPPTDPRKRKDLNQSFMNSPQILNPGGTPRLSNYPNMTPNARTYEMTPSQNFDYDVPSTKHKHVYAPAWDPSNDRDSPVDHSSPRWETNEGGKRGPRSNSVVRDDNDNRRTTYKRDNFLPRPRDPRLNPERKDDGYSPSDCPPTPSHHFGRGDCPATPSHPFGRSERPMTPVHSFGRSDFGSAPFGSEDNSSAPILHAYPPSTPSHPFGRSECPSTPSHPFGRSECPTTPSHPFGRSDCPTTPSHPFGRSDCPTTPSHPFGRSDCPTTPSHPFGRSDCPTTPSHPFGRSDCPTTPSHPFGRSDCPTTPSHPFGRSDCPTTPSHPFGRSDCPTTPSHPFGRSDCPSTPSHPFGRGYQQDRSGSNYNRNKAVDGYSKSYYEHTDSYSRHNRERSLGRNDEKQHYSHEQPNRYSRDHSYRPEPSVGRTREPSLGRIQDPSLESNADHNRGRTREPSFRYSRDYDVDSSYNEYQGSMKSHNSRYDSVRDTRSNHRERSVGRTHTDQYFNRSTLRATSVGRTFQSPSVENTVSVVGHTGRGGFTIDTSINSTFQSNTNDDAALMFNARRQRAASVGRSLTRESSVGRTWVSDFAEKINQKFAPKSNYDNTGNKDRFKRAASVGRDVNQPGKSYKDIKADFESFKLKMQHDTRQRAGFDRHESRHTTSANNPMSYLDTRKNIDKSIYQKVNIDRSVCVKSNTSVPKSNNAKPQGKINSSDPTSSPMSYIAMRRKLEKSIYQKVNVDPSVYKKISEKDAKPRENINSRDPRKRDAFLHQREQKFDRNVSKNTAYSPRRNSRDPRFRKDNRPDSRSQEDKRHGIVYTNDNIARGNILGPGAGVKNYKIPKIKRPTPPPPTPPPIEETEKEKEPQKRDKIPQKPDEKSVDVKTNKSKTELYTKNKISGKDTFKKTTTKSAKKNISCESSSESLDDSAPVRTRKKKVIAIDSDSDWSDDNTMNINTNNDTSNVQPNKLNTEDGETQKMVTAEVDKSDDNDSMNFSFDLKPGDLDMLSENIGSYTVTDLIADLDKDISDDKIDNCDRGIGLTDSTNDINFGSLIQSLPKVDSTDATTDSIQDETVKVDVMGSDNQIVDQAEIDSGANKNASLAGKINEALVTTSLAKVDLLDDIKHDSDKTASDASTPDSTFNNEDTVLPTVVSDNTDTNDPVPTVPQALPDSTISSTQHTEKSGEEIPSMASTSSEVPNDGLRVNDILSIFKNKNTLKKLLSMLDDDNDDDNIKKTFKKLSEIVSDNNEEEITNNNQMADKGAEKDESADSNVKNVVIDKFINQDNTNNVTAKVSIDSIEVTKINPGRRASEADEETAQQKSLEKQSLVVEVNKNERGGTDKDKIEEDHDTSLDAPDDIPPTDVAKPLPVKAMPQAKKIVKKPNVKGRRRKRAGANNPKRVTRSTVVPTTKSADKKPRTKPSELEKLQEDIRDMFMSNDVLNATGIRMCRLAKLVEEKNTKSDQISPTKTNESSYKSDSEDYSEIEKASPVVRLEKFTKKALDSATAKPMRKKPGPKPKAKPASAINKSKTPEIHQEISKYKPGPKSKTRTEANKQKNDDPYEFETDSVISESTTKTGENTPLNSSDEDNDDESVASSKSFGSNDLLVELKTKTKRKKGNWQQGIIKTRKTTKKNVAKVALEKQIQQLERQVEQEKHASKLKLDKLDKNKAHSEDDSDSSLNHKVPVARTVKVPDYNCFTDQNYCFIKQINQYSCRLCRFEGDGIVLHYKNEHPHYEIPLSRMTPKIAQQAIKQSMVTNFQEMSKLPIMNYICRFCDAEFSKKKKKSNLETFFWHVVSTHTGEYKQMCSECQHTKKCPFLLDIPPPPKETKRILMGYICGKCNYTQVSLENLKNHVSLRHNDEETEVYTISLGYMLQKDMEKCATTGNSPRTLRSLRSSGEKIDSDKADISDQGTTANEAQTSKSTKLLRKSVQSKIRFENEAVEDEEAKSNGEQSEGTIKSEKEDDTDVRMHDDTEPFEKPFHDNDNNLPVINTVNKVVEQENVEKSLDSSDVFVQPHFKLNYTDTGSKEYYCCINGLNHYKTSLLISMKKHVQIKHAKQTWDGYCCVCKVIVMPQGTHEFKECLFHFLDMHMDNFPQLESDPLENAVPTGTVKDVADIERPPSRSFINVRPMAQLMSPAVSQDEPALPKIESVVSLNSTISQAPSEPTSQKAKPSSSSDITAQSDAIEVKYEEVQTQIMSRKHRIVLDAMLSPDKLTQVFKCAGKFCSYTSDSTENAFLHASTHEKLGGDDGLACAYCNFDASGNAIDLVAHIFKEHGPCRFSCKLCFYRAFTGTMVEVHYVRAHGQLLEGAVLEGSQVAPVSDEGLLSRQAAVKQYACHADPTICKFVTFTPRKFCEHIKNNHPETTSHQCSECPFSSATPEHLVDHLKRHGLKLYQCTWCVFGAHNETEMLDHTSMKHPCRRPQAYLRHVIECKDGSGQFKVLPVIHIKNKKSIPTVEVPPSGKADDPVKEAERAHQLEKLLGHTVVQQKTPEPADPADEAFDNDFFEAELPSDEAPTELPMPLPSETLTAASPRRPPTPPQPKGTPPQPVATPSQPVATTPQPVAAPSQPVSTPSQPVATPSQPVATPSQPVATPSQPEATTPQPEATPPQPVATPPQPVTPPSRVSVAEQVTPELKKEPQEPMSNRASATEVICLDSDEEDSQPVGLSDDNDSTIERQLITSEGASDGTVRVPAESLFKCGKCLSIHKKAYFLKRHFRQCFVNEKLKCAFCAYTSDDEYLMIKHYSNDHEEVNKYFCGVCKYEAFSVKLMKKHMAVHGVLRLEYRLIHKSGGKLHYMVEKQEAKKRGRKSTEAPVVAPAKIRRFGPDDVSCLPVSQIFEAMVQCALCEFSTKVRQNMVRHLQQHRQSQAVSATAPVNPVPHLDSNEMHFDKMLNLAASSAPQRSSTEPAVACLLPPEQAAIYPAHVPDRLRYACGARGCSYISIDESMLRCHWDTLHSGTDEYRCQHCPASQQLDRSRPVTAPRILAHLKMHDARLYACTACTYYHHLPHVLQKHLQDKHQGRAQVKTVREPAVPSVPAVPAVPAASSMDLKAWRCGLCDYKSMLRAAVVQHCSEAHQSKFQYKCAFCPWRSSGLDNVTKHHANSHAGRTADVFYFYYREGDVPDGPDGVPLWERQRRKAGNPPPQVKKEDGASAATTPTAIKPAAAAPAVEVDLNIVKNEVVDDTKKPESLIDLCRKFGKFTDPNGLKYCCPLCNATEITKGATQSHLYEELKYRKWGCRICSYKAFHKQGLQEHASVEHRQNLEPVELAADPGIELWVAKLLEHQEKIINKNRNKLPLSLLSASVQGKDNPSTSKAQEVEAPPSTARSAQAEQAKSIDRTPSNLPELEKAFGPFGAPSDMMFCCPKCDFKVKAEDKIIEHLEIELTKIRWCCDTCPEKLQAYHQAQLHCKTAHAGQSARVVKANADVAMRAQWRDAVISTQRRAMTLLPATEADSPEKHPPEGEHSLLTVRYEESIPTPEDAPAHRKRSRLYRDDSDDDERLIIDEQPAKKTTLASAHQSDKCPYCDFCTLFKSSMQTHVLRHYDLKPYNCPYCGFNGHSATVHSHIEKLHPGLPNKSGTLIALKVPEHPPKIYELPVGSSKSRRKSSVDLTSPDEDSSPASDTEPYVYCLICNVTVREDATHEHADTEPRFAGVGDVIYDCHVCAGAFSTYADIQQHYATAHPDTVMKYRSATLHRELGTQTYVCTSTKCRRRFKLLPDVQQHSASAHPGNPLRYKIVTSPVKIYKMRSKGDPASVKRKLTDDAFTTTPKRISKKSTTKPPFSKIAKKSTAKLPIDVDCLSEGDNEEENSFHATRPSESIETGRVPMPMTLTQPHDITSDESGVKTISD